MTDSLNNCVIDKNDCDGGDAADATFRVNTIPPQSTTTATTTAITTTTTMTTLSDVYLNVCNHKFSDVLLTLSSLSSLSSTSSSCSYSSLPTMCADVFPVAPPRTVRPNSALLKALKEIDDDNNNNNNNTDEDEARCCYFDVDASNMMLGPWGCVALAMTLYMHCQQQQQQRVCLLRCLSVRGCDLHTGACNVFVSFLSAYLQSSTSSSCRQHVEIDLSDNPMNCLAGRSILQCVVATAPAIVRLDVGGCNVSATHERLISEECRKNKKKQM
eukprot:PhM_4_TR17784/c0_g1_i1/m.103800